MSVIKPTKPFTFISGTVGSSSEVNSDFDVIYSKVGEVVDELEAVANAAIENVYFSSKYANLVAVVAAAGNGMVVVNTTCTSSNNVTIPENVALTVVKGGSINHGDYSLTINGSLTVGSYQVFTGSGQVILGPGSVSEILPNWFGSSNAIQKAIDCAHNSSVKIVKIPNGYSSVETLTYYSDVTVYDYSQAAYPTIYIGSGDAEFTLKYPNLDAAATNAPYLTLHNMRNTLDQSSGIMFRNGSPLKNDWQIMNGVTYDAYAWQSNHSYNKGALVYDANKICTFRAEGSGISGGSAPTWPMSFYSTVVDGGVTWRNIGSYWRPTLDFNSYQYPTNGDKRKRLQIGQTGAFLFNTSLAYYDPEIAHYETNYSYIFNNPIDNTGDFGALFYSNTAGSIFLDFRAGSDGYRKRLIAAYNDDYLRIKGSDLTTDIVAFGDTDIRFKGLRHIYNTYTAAPVSGTWEVGEIVWNKTPAAGGYIGWVCVVAGTPGTWKGFGAIAV